MARMALDPRERFQELFAQDKYRVKLRHMALNDERSLTLDFLELSVFDEELARGVLSRSEDYLQYAASALKAQMRYEDEQYAEAVERFHVRIRGLPSKISIRNIGASHIERLVAFDGIIVRATPVKPLLVEAVFQCKCGAENRVPQQGSFIRPPMGCESCGRTVGFELIPEKSKFIDYQELRVQERPEDLPPGQLPRYVEVYLEDDLVDKARPGDRVTITGVVRARPETLPGRGKLRTFSTAIEANHVEVVGKELETIEVSLEDEKRIRELARDEFIHKRIISSIAPSIYGYEDIKEAIMYLLFGGVPKVTPEGVTIRGDIHVLLVGDPGTAKCVSGDTLIFTVENGLTEIRSLVEGCLQKVKVKPIDDGVYAEMNHTTPTLGLDGKVKEGRTTRVWKRFSPSVMYRITTRTGRTITVTPTHPFFTCKDGFIVPIQAANLKLGDYIATLRNAVLEGDSQKLNAEHHCSRDTSGARTLQIPVQTTPELCKLIGYLLGDGYCRKASSTYYIVFTSKEQILREDYSRCFESVFNVKPYLPPSHKSELWVSSVVIGKFLENIAPELYKPSRERRIPNLIFKCSNEEVKSFLEGFFDSEATISRKERELTIVSASRLLLEGIRFLLLRFGIVSQLHFTRTQATNSPNPKRKTYYRLRVSGSELLKMGEILKFKNPMKAKKLEALINCSRRLNTNLDVIPGVDEVLRKIRLQLGLSRNALGLPESTIKHYEKGDRNISRARLKIIIERFKTYLKNPTIEEVKILKEISRLEKLANSDIFWDKVQKIEKVKPVEEWVYDIEVERTHNFVANTFIVHNSQLLRYVAKISPRGLYTTGRGTTAAGLTAAVLRERAGGMVLEAGALVLADKGVAAVDEIDKMRDEDRIAMHEMMEQQSYHPSVEVMLADGCKVKIGEYVDGLFKTSNSNLIRGVDCEILPFRSSQEVYSVDLSSNFIQRVKIDRVSRHKAPSKFVKICFSNGREVLVTPEHPVYVYKNGRLQTVMAIDIMVGDFIPAPRELPNSNVPVKLEGLPQASEREKAVRLPGSLTPELAKVLGYLISEGCFYEGSTCEIGFANTNHTFLCEVSQLFDAIFGVKPTISTNKDSVAIQRYISPRLYKWFLLNFPEIIPQSRFKRVPQKIFAASKPVIIEFLKSAFLGDGSVESSAICYRTASRGLAEDYQDLLLKLGISSRIVHDRTNGSFKVYISGDSLETFFDLIAEPKDPRYEEMKFKVKHGKRINRYHDAVPASIAWTMIRLLKDLGLPYDGYFNEHLKNNYGITVQVFKKCLNLLKSRAKVLQDLCEIDEVSIKALRNKLGFSQRRLAEIVGVKRSTIDYAERGGYGEREREKLLSEIVCRVKRHLSRINGSLLELQSLLKFRFLRVSSVEVVPNEGQYKADWVYDITVEPFHNFISQGVLLHNTISVAKGGIIATLNARTSILAAANPKLGRYEGRLTVAENINIPVVILSRFDLIFVERDEPDKELDLQLADHILNVHRRGGPVMPPIPPEILRKYVSYARSKVYPRLSEEAAEHLKQFYLKMREASQGAEGSPIAITPRQLEALIRIAEARARVALRDIVTREDAEAAIRIMRKSLQAVGAVQEGEVVDIDTIMTGKPAALRDKLVTVMRAVEELQREYGEADVEELYRRLEEYHGIGRGDAEKIVKRALQDGILYSPKPGYLRKTGTA